MNLADKHMRTSPQDLIKNVAFRFVQPSFPMRASFYPNSPARNPLIFIIKKYLRLIENQIELGNTRLRGADPRRIKKIKELCGIPKMSTLAIGYIIDGVVSQMKENTCYLSIGVWNGFTFLSGMVNNPTKKCIGVDNFSEFGEPKEDFLARFHRYKSTCHHFFEMDYEKYFTDVHKDRIGFYIYDGEHSYENQLKGLKIAEPFFADECVVLIDDTNIPKVHRATTDFISQSRNRYKVLLDQKTAFNAHPTYWNGLIIFQKVKAVE